MAACASNSFCSVGFCGVRRRSGECLLIVGGVFLNALLNGSQSADFFRLLLLLWSGLYGIQPDLLFLLDNFCQIIQFFFVGGDLLISLLFCVGLLS